MWIKEWGALGICLSLRSRELWEWMCCFGLIWWKVDFFSVLQVQNSSYPYWLTFGSNVYLVYHFLHPASKRDFFSLCIRLYAFVVLWPFSALQVSFREMWVCFILFHMKSFCLKADYRMLPPKICDPYINVYTDHVIKLWLLRCLYCRLLITYLQY